MTGRSVIFSALTPSIQETRPSSPPHSGRSSDTSCFPAATVFAVLVILGVILTGTWRRAYVALLFGIGLVLWIQANLLVANYGPLDGSTIDWSPHAWRNKYEIALWAAVPALAVLASKTIAPVAPFASGVLVALQAVLLTASAVQADPAHSSRVARTIGRHVRASRENRTLFTSSWTGFIPTYSLKFSKPSVP